MCLGFYQFAPERKEIRGQRAEFRYNSAFSHFFREIEMKKNIHPDYRQVKLICSCGNELTVGAAMEQDSLRLDICSKCHPFYTGKQKLVDTSGCVERFRRRFGSRATSSA